MASILLAVPSEHSLEGALYPPAGLLYLAAYAIPHGHKVTVIDGQVQGDEAVYREIVENKYDYFGITILSPMRHNCFLMIKKIKELSPSTAIIAGGAHPSLMPKDVLGQHPEIDIAVIGEGEETLLEILDGRNLEDIPGIAFKRNGEGGGEETAVNPLREPMDVERIPIPAWHLIDIHRYKSYEERYIDGKPLGPMLTIYSSRGCTGKCSFCSTWRVWRKFRQMSARRFVDEVRLLYDQGIDHFFIADDSMISNLEFVKDFCRLLQEEGMRIHYKIACRADKITDEIAAYLKESGCYEVHIGFESGSPKILSAMNKMIDVEQNKLAAGYVRKHGMGVYALMLFGHFGEDVQSMNETIRFLREIRPDGMGTMGHLMILPGTVDFNRAVKLGYVDRDFWNTEAHYLPWYGTFTPKQFGRIMYFVQTGKTIWSKSLLRWQYKLYKSLDRIFGARKLLP